MFILRVCAVYIPIMGRRLVEMKNKLNQSNRLITGTCVRRCRRRRDGHHCSSLSWHYFVTLLRARVICSKCSYACSRPLGYVRPANAQAIISARPKSQLWTGKIIRFRMQRDNACVGIYFFPLEHSAVRSLTSGSLASGEYIGLSRWLSG